MLGANLKVIEVISMRGRKALESLYGSAGADVAQAAPGVGIATDDGNRVFHVHFRGNRDVTDDVLRLVGNLTDLEELVANETSISDAGLAYIQVLPKLRLLHLSGTAISDTGIRHLLELPLVLLDLSVTHVSDAGLECISGIRSLQELSVKGCSVSEGGIQRFQKQVSKCKVYR